jgi:hypothetical protein
MSKEQFETLLNNYQSFQNKIAHFYSFGLDLMEGKLSLTVEVENILDTAIQSHYDKEGCDWVNWFLYENDFGRRGLEATQYDKPICYDISSLYEYLEKNHKL